MDKAVSPGSPTGSAGMLTAIAFSLAVPAAYAQTWSRPTSLVPLSNADVIGRHRVAENPAGQIAAAWEQGQGVRARIRTGTQWSLTQALGDALATTSLADMAMASNGEIAVLLNSTAAGGGPVTMQSVFFTNGAWSPAVPVPVTTGQAPLAARIAYDGNGQATLVWAESDGTRCSIRATTGTAANGWGPAVLVGSGCYDLLQLAVNPRGDAVLALGATVIPRPGSRAGSPAFGAFRLHGGSWTALADVGSSGIGNGPYQTAPTVAIAPTGAALMLLSDANVGVKWSRKSPANNSWSPTAMLDGAEPAVPTAVAMDAKGNAVAAFPAYYANVGPAPLMAATLAYGSFQWGPAQTVTDPGSDIGAFALGATPAGSFVVGWADSFAVGGPANASATLGVSVLPAATTVWSTTTLDADFSYASPSADTMAVAAASRKAAVLWNMQTRATGTGTSLLKISTAKLP